jgi:HEAT repeat protein
VDRGGGDTSPRRLCEVATAESGAADIAALVRTLSEKTDETSQVVVIDQLAEAGQNAKAAIDALVKATAHPSERVRWHAARAIGLIGEDAIANLPTLVGLLNDDDPIVVAQSAAAIGLIRVDDERTDTPAKDAALYAAAIEPLTTTTVHPDPRARRAALRALLALHASPQAVAPLLAKQLADADPSVVLPVLHTLADMDEAGMPFLIEALKDARGRYWAAGEPEERLQAFLTLAAIGEKAAAATPVAIKALESDDNSLRFAAAFALGQMKAANADAALRKAAAGTDPFLATVASWALARIHPDDASLSKEAVKRLRERLDDDNPKARAAAASGLSDLATLLDAGERQALAREFAPLLRDPDPATATSGGAALIRLGPDAVDTLRGLLSDPVVRVAALEILAALGDAAAPATDELIGLLGDEDEHVKGDAAVALGAIGPAAAKAVPSLEKILANGGGPSGPRYAAAYALARSVVSSTPTTTCWRPWWCGRSSRSLPKTPRSSKPRCPSSARLCGTATTMCGSRRRWHWVRSARRPRVRSRCSNWSRKTTP